jgi:hypothetical protein
VVSGQRLASAPDLETLKLSNFREGPLNGRSLFIKRDEVHHRTGIAIGIVMSFRVLDRLCVKV